MIEVFDTDLGWVAIMTRGETLQRLTFGHATAAEAKAALGTEAGGESGDQVARVALDSADWRRELIGQLAAYASSRLVDFSGVPLDESQWSDFQRRVLSACRRIPYGKLQTYGQLAAAAGSPGAARAVGRVMATNPLPIVVPCHRVVGAAGDLRGYSARGGMEMKERLMKLEGAEMPHRPSGRRHRNTAAVGA
jgi:methylated-DNA-[protein]-cysteine S-methyltransferase